MNTQELKTLKDLDLEGKSVLLRADLDVPIPAQKGKNYSIRLLTIKKSVDYILSHGAKRVIIIGHIDRPNRPDPFLSTRQLLEPLSEILGEEMSFLKDFGKTQNGKIWLFENLRFWKGETDNDTFFAEQLSKMGDVYVNDAFGNSHRNHASIVKLAELLPSAAGLQVISEVDNLSHLLINPKHPFTALIAGAKIDTKIPVIKNLSKVADNILIGGYLPLEIEKGEIDLSSSVIVARLNVNKKDIDDSSIERFAYLIKGAKTIVWNGSIGFVEEGFTKGMLSVAKAIISSRAKTKIVGGGDTTGFLEENNLLSHFSFVSNGGGAMLKYLSGEKLPGLEVLRKNNSTS